MRLRVSEAVAPIHPFVSRESSPIVLSLEAALNIPLDIASRKIRILKPLNKEFFGHPPKVLKNDSLFDPIDGNSESIIHANNNDQDAAVSRSGFSFLKNGVMTT